MGHHAHQTARVFWLNTLSRHLPDMAERGQIEIVLDLSRLMSRSLHAMPSGVDRVELAYARTLIAQHPGKLSFAATHPLGLYGRLADDCARRFLDETEQRWSGKAKTGWLNLRLSAARHLWRLRPRRVPKFTPGSKRVLLQSSPADLHDPRKIAAKLSAEQAPFICLLHDLIPIEFPEYARPGGAEKHRVRMQTLARYATGVIANSNATAESFLRFLSDSSPNPIVRVAHLGTAPLDTPPEGPLPPRLMGRSYFVVIGTIEPRKNHLLLLHIWRRMAEVIPDADLPILVVIGRRGWENENIIDMLDRSDAVRRHTIEYSDLDDRAMAAILAQARALLLPSFAEGFGMPVSEAIAAGVPVLCSDIPALREAGDGLADYLDPLDGPAWIEAILDYAKPDSVRRAAQLDRIEGWSPPDWKSHLDVALQLVEEVCG